MKIQIIDGKTYVTKVSELTQKTAKLQIDVTRQQIAKWQSGASLQSAFPDLSADDAEFIKTGITKQEWDKLFTAW
jgi:hypothetical protein